jgi:hypothetical protein
MDIRILVYQKKSRIVILNYNPALKKQEHAKYQEKNFGARLRVGLRFIMASLTDV